MMRREWWLRGLVGLVMAWPDAVFAQALPMPPAEVHGAREVTVRCTLSAPADTPCMSEAERACKGAAHLQAIRSQAKIPVTEGVDQHGAPLYQYEAVYACEKTSPP